MTDKKDDQYSDKEAKTRFEAALRRARITGHKKMADLRKKRMPKKVKRPGK